MVFPVAALLSGQSYADALIGAKVELMNLDVATSKDPVNLAVNMGYEFDSYIADFSLVGEVGRSAISGELAGGDDVDFEYESAYLLWKTTRSLFVTLRGGMVRNKVVTNGSYQRGDGLLIGASVGIVIGRTRLQIEFTKLADDAEFFGVGMEI